MTFMVLIEFLLTWRHGHLTLIKKWAFRKIYCVIHPVPSPVIRSYKCSLLQLNWIVRKTNFFFHKNKDQMNHQTILTPMTSSFLQRVLCLSFSLSLSTTFAKTLFNLIDFQGATLLFRYHSSFVFVFFLMLKSFVEIPTLSGHQSTWIELHAKTKHKEIYSFYDSASGICIQVYCLFAHLSAKRIRWTDRNLLSFFTHFWQVLS